MDEETLIVLKRIAIALEKIADKMEKQNTDEETKEIITEITDLNNIPQYPTYKREEIDVNILIEKLAEKNITIKTYQTKEEENTSLDHISKFMGTRYHDIKKVYETMKRYLNKPYGFHLDLKNSTQAEITSSCQLCNNLYEIAFLSEYKYDKSPRFCIHATPNKIPIAINFLTGHWLEIFIRKSIQDCLNKMKTDIKYTYLINPQITLPNGDDFELDVVFLINDEIYWVEGKTGNYQHYINKYSDVANIMNLDKNHSFLVLTDVPNPNTAYILSKTFEMTILAVEDFEEEIRYVFYKNFNLQLPELEKQEENDNPNTIVIPNGQDTLPLR